MPDHYDHIPRKSIAAKEHVSENERKSVAATTRRQDRARRKQVKKEGRKQRPLQTMDKREGASARVLRGGPDHPTRYRGATTPREQRLLAKVKSRTRRAKGGLGAAVAVAAFLANKIAGKKTQSRGPYSTPAMAMATRHALTIPGARTNIPGIEKRRGR